MDHVASRWGTRDGNFQKQIHGNFRQQHKCLQLQDDQRLQFNHGKPWTGLLAPEALDDASHRMSC